MNKRSALMSLLAAFDTGHMTEAELSWRLASHAVRSIARSVRYS